MTIDKLKQFAKLYNLKTSGKKQLLIERIKQYLTQTSLSKLSSINATGTDLLKINKNIVNSSSSTLDNDLKTYTYNWAGVSGSYLANPCKNKPLTPIFNFDINSCIPPTIAPILAISSSAPTLTLTQSTGLTTPMSCCRTRFLKPSEVREPKDIYYNQSCGPAFATAKYNTNLTTALKNTTCKGLVPTSIAPTLKTDPKTACFTYTPTTLYNNCTATSPFEDMSSIETIYSKRAQWFQNRQLLNSV
jgi:hypothetical protein